MLTEQITKEKPMTRPSVERREGPDLRIKLLTWSGLLSGASLVAALLITAVAKPEIQTFFDRFYDLRLRRTWDLELTQYLFYLDHAQLPIAHPNLPRRPCRLARTVVDGPVLHQGFPSSQPPGGPF